MQQWGRGLLLTSCDLIKSHKAKYFKHKVRQELKSVSNENHKNYSLGGWWDTDQTPGIIQVELKFREVCHENHRSPGGTLKLHGILEVL